MNNEEITKDMVNTALMLDAAIEERVTKIMLNVIDGYRPIEDNANPRFPKEIVNGVTYIDMNSVAQMFENSVMLSLNSKLRTLARDEVKKMINQAPL